MCNLLCIANALQILMHFLFWHTICPRMALVVVYVQFGIGYLGIAFLSEEQTRRNQLIRLPDTSAEERISSKEGVDATTNNGLSSSSSEKEKEEEKEEDVKRRARLAKADKFQRSAAPFILFTAVPYMLQIIFYGKYLYLYLYMYIQNFHGKQSM